MNSTTIKRAVVTAGITALAGLGTMIGASAAAAAPAGDAAAAASPNKQIAYVRAGAIYVTNGVTEVRLTEDSVSSRPRFSPDGKKLAYLHNGTVWVMNADGSAKQQVSDRTGGGPSWSPDGKWIAYSAMSCDGGAGVFRTEATGGLVNQVIFPASCRDQAVPQVGYITEVATDDTTAGPTLTEKLRSDGAVAWSPDGTQIAFRGGECESIADACLSIGNVATGGEVAIDVYGGGGSGESGFGVVPAWSPNGKKVAWTAYGTDGKALHVDEADVSGANRHQVGRADDREMVYLSAGKGLLTSPYQGHSWITTVDLATGKHTPLRQGSQPTVQV